MQYYFRTCFRIIAKEGRENNPALISNKNRPALLALPLPREGDSASRSWAFLDRATHSLDGTKERGVSRIPETPRGRLQRAVLETGHGPRPHLTQKAGRLCCFSLQAF